MSRFHFDLPRYRCLLVDPPWNERGGGKIKRGADRHYKLLKTPEIIETILASPLWNPAADAHLWLWVTNNHLPDGLRVMKGLGFRYVTNWVWVKDRVGLGRYSRGQHELLLFGTSGKAMVPTPPNRPSTVISAPRGEHSVKPAAAYDVVEMVSPGPRAEFFARSRHSEEWDVWGDEAP